jgi:hypothetical protein
VAWSRKFSDSVEMLCDCSSLEHVSMFAAWMKGNDHGAHNSGSWDQWSL